MGENWIVAVYVRLDLGSGDFSDPRGSNYFAKIEKWVRLGRNLREGMEVKLYVSKNLLEA